MFASAPSTGSVEADAHYRKACGVCIDYSIMIGREELLFDEVYERFCEAEQQGVFLQLLEPFMLTDHLRQLAPKVLQDFVQYYQERRWLDRVEQCLMHMDVSVIDFNLVAKLCRDHSLYSGLIYIFNAGCNDYIYPAEELFTAMADADAVGGNGRNDELCTRLLRYIYDCMTRSGECGRVSVHDYRTSMRTLRDYLFAVDDTSVSPPAAVPRVMRLLQLNTAGTVSVK